MSASQAWVLGDDSPILVCPKMTLTWIFMVIFEHGNLYKVTCVYTNKYIHWYLSIFIYIYFDIIYIYIHTIVIDLLWDGPAFSQHFQRTGRASRTAARGGRMGQRSAVSSSPKNQMDDFAIFRGLEDEFSVNIGCFQGLWKKNRG